MRFYSKIFGILVLIILPIALAMGANINPEEQTLIGFATIGDHPQFLTKNPAPVYDFSYVPRVYLSGYGGTGLLGQADVLAPIFLRTNLNLFVYGQGRYGYEKNSWDNDTWTGSLGLGYRQIVGDTAVLGAYVIGDYTCTTSDHTFTVISPGIESLGRAWEFRANGYFPLGKKTWQNKYWADQLGYYQDVRFQGHDQYDHMLAYYQETGMGADAEVGRKLFTIDHMLVKGYINGFYFNLKDNNDLLGAGVRVTLQPTRYLEISLDDSYDRYSHNVFMAGMRISLYDLFTAAGRNLPADTKDLQDRLFDPIERNFGSLASGSSVPFIQNNTPKDLGEGIERSNIWFFKDYSQSSSAEGSSFGGGDGTYENPFTADEFNQNRINYINQIASGASLYFSSGNYNSFNGTDSIFLNAGQSMWGRMNGPKGYQRPAIGDSRALFHGALSLGGNNTLDSIQLQNVASASQNKTSDYLFDTGIEINNVNNVTMNNIAVGANGNYSTGIYLRNAHNINIANSYVLVKRIKSVGSDLYSKGIDSESSDLNVGNGNTIIAVGSTHDSQIVGIYSKNGILNILGNNNVISASTEVNSTQNGFIARAFGVSATGGSVDISGNNNTISGQIRDIGTYAASTFYAFGLRMYEGNVTIRGNNNIFSGAGYFRTVTFQANETGLEVKNGNLYVSGNNNTFSGMEADSSGIGSGRGIEIYGGDSRELVVMSGRNNKIQATGSKNAYGIRLLTKMSGEFKVEIENVIFDIGFVSNETPTLPVSAYGLIVSSLVNTNNITIRNSTFNVNTNSGTAGWGIYALGGYTPAKLAELIANNSFYGDAATNKVGP